MVVCLWKIYLHLECIRQGTFLDVTNAWVSFNLWYQIIETIDGCKLVVKRVDKQFPGIVDDN